MAIKENIVDNVAILTLSGNLMGGEETNELREKIYNLINNNNIKVIIDLNKAKWVNSSGLGALLACHTSLVNKNGQLKLACATDKVQSLMMITQLIKIFENYDSVEEAISSFKK